MTFQNIIQQVVDANRKARSQHAGRMSELINITTSGTHDDLEQFARRFLDEQSQGLSGEVGGTQDIDRAAGS